MLTRATSAGSSSASGPVASVAQATASGRSRNDGRREIASSSARSAGTSSRRAVEPVRQQRLRDGQPARLEPPVALQEAERARDDPAGWPFWSAMSPIAVVCAYPRRSTS